MVVELPGGRCQQVDGNKGGGTGDWERDSGESAMEAAGRRLALLEDLSYWKIRLL